MDKYKLFLDATKTFKESAQTAQDYMDFVIVVSSVTQCDGLFWTEVKEVLIKVIDKGEK